MPHLHGEGRSHKLVVQRRIGRLHIALELIERDPVVSFYVALIHDPETIQIADPSLSHAGDIDLIKSKPIFDLVLIAAENRLCIAEEESDGLSGVEAVIFCHDAPRNLVVAQGHQRLNSVPGALIKYLIVECQPRLIGLLIVAVRKDPSPVDGQPEAGKAHLREQRDILFIAMVKVNRLMAGIKCRRIRLGKKSSGRVHITTEQHVRDAESLAVLQIGSLALIGRYGASPQKILGKSHHCLLFIFHHLLSANHSLTIPHIPSRSPKAE